RIVSELKAKHFVFENVKGLTVGKHKKFLREVISEFARAGYTVREPWKVLNAVNYGVPQDRQRLFLIGSKGKTPAQYPAPITRAADDPESALPLAPTCR